MFSACVSGVPWTTCPADLGRTVVVIGNFDGVHLGHRHVVRRARELADRDGLSVVAVTFDPHPMAVLRPEHAPLTLTDIDRRCLLLSEAGVDDVFVIPFSREIAAWTPDRVHRPGAGGRAARRGTSWSARTSASAPGRPVTSRRWSRPARDRDFEVEGIALDGGPQVWSSTYVRTCLAAGDVEGAAEALGRPYSVVGHVVEGEHRGRELGYPTANVPTRRARRSRRRGVRRLAGPARRQPGDGQPLPAAISVGTNPTFDGERERRVEAYVLDRDRPRALRRAGGDLVRRPDPRGWSSSRAWTPSSRRWPRTSYGPGSCWGSVSADIPGPTPLAATDAWFLRQRPVRSSCPSGAPRCRRALPAATLVPFVVVTVLVAAAAGVGLALFAEARSLAPSAC